MTENLDRDALIELLERLGDESDEAALAAARQIHAEVAAAGFGWDRLLAAEMEAEPEAEPEAADAETDSDEEDDAAASPAPAASMDDKQALSLIDGLLARPGISEYLREELLGYKEDIAEGAFEEMDRNYLRALNARLPKRR